MSQNERKINIAKDFVWAHDTIIVAVTICKCWMNREMS